MKDAVIVELVRTPVGRRHGSLSGWHSAELLGETLNALVGRAGVDPAIVDDVMVGCVTQVGAQSTNIARTAVLAAGWPVSVPGTTMDRQCGSSQQAIHFAAQSIMSGVNDVVVAAGIEMMSAVPMFSNAPGGDITAVYGDVASDRFADREAFGHYGLVPQGISAEMIASRWGIDRAALDAFALSSHVKAAAARDSGRTSAQIVPTRVKRRDRETGEITVADDLLSVDECIRDTSLEALSGLAPVFVPTGVITAGNSSQISDGAAAVLVMSANRAAELGLRPRAVIRTMTVAGADPVEMLSAPIPATQRALDRAGLSISDIDAFEVNEAFAPVVLAWANDLKADLDRVNVDGGAIALGHPLGASGARLMVTLISALERQGGGLGLQTMCEGGGMANATIVEVPGA
jgi:acetyl-CoA acetyltransferase family protein